MGTARGHAAPDEEGCSVIRQPRRRGVEQAHSPVRAERRSHVGEVVMFATAQ